MTRKMSGLFNFKNQRDKVQLVKIMVSLKDQS